MLAPSAPTAPSAPVTGPVTRSVAAYRTALELALAQIDKQFGKGSVMRLGERPVVQTAVIPTSSIALDVALGVGGIVTQESPIHISNVQVLDSAGKPTRIGYRIDENGTKVRIARTTGKEL